MTAITPLPTRPAGSRLCVEFCGEWYEVSSAGSFGIGRDAELELDSNPFLHRRLMEIALVNGLWMLTNVGSRIALTVMDGSGRMQSWLAPGARLPLVFEQIMVVFSAGPTTYELSIFNSDQVFGEAGVSPSFGQTTVGLMDFTESQKLLMVALAEPALLRDGTGMSEVPTNAKAAERLGWALTRFNRKLDNVCDKLDRCGVKGLRGGRGEHAMNRRARLVEYAIAARLVTRTDLTLLERKETS